MYLIYAISLKKEQSFEQFLKSIDLLLINITELKYHTQAKVKNYLYSNYKN